ncbi:MAG: hypothetical protein NDJ92_18575 [Thermoanaerobaculia bacterium]|nr:hypothetical protein [Thermoanaerobaculia bacterium]
MSAPMSRTAVERLTTFIAELVSETNGLALHDTLSLACQSTLAQRDDEAARLVAEFRDLLDRFRIDAAPIEQLLAHPFSLALEKFLLSFPLAYREEHIHLTGSLSPEFLFPRLEELLAGPHGELCAQKIREVYGPDSLPLRSVADVERLVRLGENERFDRYLRILYLPKLLLTTREAHRAAAYHLASRLWRESNVGAVRLKFTLFRNTTDPAEQVPGIESLTIDDVVLGLYEGFRSFQSEVPTFEFILSPCFRKEPGFYDAERFPTRRAHFDDQVRQIIDLLARHPELREHLTEVDTVGNERGFYRKAHFQELRVGLRKLQAHGFQVRSHHGETWGSLRQGIQAVDNAMNIWHVDAIEHGLSLGINPNFYFQRLAQRLLEANAAGRGVAAGSVEATELGELDWNGREEIRDRLLRGVRLSEIETTRFIKAKFHTAREVEHYQHDVINRMIDKRLSIIALPSSNKRLTGAFESYKDHPFSWWEKKGLKLGVGTDNDITLGTSYLREMLILLYTDPLDLKIMKLLLVTTGETRRPYISHQLWQMRKRLRRTG